MTATRIRPARAITALAAVLTLLLGALTPAAPATAGEKGKISGVVRTVDDQHVGENDYWLELYRWQQDEWVWVDDTATTSGGGYTFSNLKAGTYTVFATSSLPNYADQWLGRVYEKADARRLDLAAGASISDADFRVPHLSTLEVTAVDGDGLPLALHVIVYRVTGPGIWDYEVSNYSGTGDDGLSVVDVSPGTYLVYVEDWDMHYAEQWFDGATLAKNATRIRVHENDTVQVTLEVVEGATVSGTVVDTAGEPVPQLELTLHRPDQDGDWMIVQGALTDEDGAYTFPGLPAGEYVVEYNSDEYQERSAAVESVFSGGALFVDLAESIQLGPEEAFDAGVTELGAAVTVHVNTLNVDGKSFNGYPDVQLWAPYKDTWRYWGRGWFGNEQIVGVPVGEYRIGVVPGQYLPVQWWREAYTDSEAQTIALEEPGLSEPTMTLGGGVKISGKAKVGSKLRAEFTVPETAVKKVYGYHWYSGKDKYLGSGTSWKVTKAQKGDRIHAVVEWKQRQYSAVKSYSPKTKPVAG